jgi:hypothetical protein
LTLIEQRIRQYQMTNLKWKMENGIYLKTFAHLLIIWRKHGAQPRFGDQPWSSEFSDK